MHKFDAQIRECLSERILTPQRVKNMLTQLKKQMNQQDGELKLTISQLEKASKETDLGLGRLYEGVEQGFFDLDDSLKARVHKLKVKREEILIELSKVKQRQLLPIKKITNRHVDAFCQAMKTRLNDPDSGFEKGYIKLLVDGIRINEKQAVMEES